MSLFPYQSEIQKSAKDHSLDPLLVAAICFVESSFQPESSRYEYRFADHYITNNPKYCTLPEEIRVLLATSLGLLQIMGMVANEMGLSVFDLKKLFEPETGLEYGCRYLKKLSGKYGSRGLEALIASYNAGSPRKGPKGNWVNYKYVNKVVKKYQEFKKLCPNS